MKLYSQLLEAYKRQESRLKHFEIKYAGLEKSIEERKSEEHVDASTRAKVEAVIVIDQDILLYFRKSAQRARDAEAQILRNMRVLKVLVVRGGARGKRGEEGANESHGRSASTPEIITQVEEEHMRGAQGVEKA